MAARSHTQVMRVLKHAEHGWTWEPRGQIIRTLIKLRTDDMQRYALQIIVTPSRHRHVSIQLLRSSRVSRSSEVVRWDAMDPRRSRRHRGNLADGRTAPCHVHQHLDGADENDCLEDLECAGIHEILEAFLKAANIVHPSGRKITIPGGLGSQTGLGL